MFLIRSVGIDLSSVSSGLAALTLREGTWSVGLKALKATRSRGGIKSPNEFYSHLEVLDAISCFVETHRPHVVGLEHYTNQNRSYVAFSMGNIGGMVRLRLWEMGVHVVLFTPNTLISWADAYSKPTPTPKDPNKRSRMTRDERKAQTRKYFVDNILAPGMEVEGNDKELEDMTEAGIYALMGAMVFARYKFKSMPKLPDNQYDVVVRRAADPGKFMLRNPAKETSFLDSSRQAISYGTQSLTPALEVVNG